MLQELKPFQKKFGISGEHAGLHLLLHSRDRNVTEKELLARAASAGVRVYGMSDALIAAKEETAAREATVILGYGGLKKEQIAEGLNELKQAWL